jgi:dUTP pyrophosphatase
MKVKIKKLHENAVIPSYSREGDAALDLTAVDITINELEDNTIAEVKLGIAVEIPKGYVGLIYPRSSIVNKNCLFANSVGVIDSNYRGELMMKFFTGYDFAYIVGDRVGQLMIIPYPTIEFEEVEELSETNRGDQGFGSSGN